MSDLSAIDKWQFCREQQALLLKLVIAVVTCRIEIVLRKHGAFLRAFVILKRFRKQRRQSLNQSLGCCGKMVKLCQLFCIFLILLLGISGRAEDFPELTEKDVDQFIRDTPAFIAEVKNQHLDGQLIGLFLHPEQIKDDLPLRQILIGLQINPDHYAYIFSHVILGGFIRDMGEFGDGKVKFLKDQRKKWQASNEPDKDKVVAELDRSIPDVEEIAEKTKKIPIAELQLFWGRRDELNDILMGKLPVKRKELRKTF